MLTVAFALYALSRIRQGLHWPRKRGIHLPRYCLKASGLLTLLGPVIAGASLQRRLRLQLPPHRAVAEPTDPHQSHLPVRANLSLAVPAPMLQDQQAHPEGQALPAVVQGPRAEQAHPEALDRWTQRSQQQTWTNPGHLKS